jgi:thiamine-monophosphate kinase
MPGPNSGDTELGPAARRGGGEFGEFQVIGRLASALEGRGGRPGPGEAWIGDDAAVVALPGGGRIVLTADLVVAGVHGDLALMSVADLGWRAMVASLSDVAAMGAAPGRALVSVASPPETELASLFAGVGEAAAAFGCPVVGGDLSGASQLVVSVAMTGLLAPGTEPVLRSGARPGDRIFVTGPLGASAAGLRLLRHEAATEARPASAAPGASPACRDALVAAYRRPRPQLAAGQAARAGGASAMVDVSDGLAGDLGHLADASGVGFAIDALPLSEGAELDDALYGGEDYQLVLACPEPAALRRAFEEAGLPAPLEIGVCLADTTRRLCGAEPVGARSFEHAVRWSGRGRRRRPT